MVFATIDGGLFLVVYCQETLGKSSSIIFNAFLFNKSLKAKCLSSQLTAKRLEIPALCMVCAVLCVFVKKVFFTCVDTCVIQHCTATSHAILNQFLVSLPWLETLLISFPIAQ